MTRRDFAIVFWAYVGIELLVGGLARLASLVPAGGRPGTAIPAAFQGVSLALGIVFVAAGAAALRHRGRLADWLLGAGGSPAVSGDHGADRGADGAALAWDLGALGVAAIGFSRLTEGLALLPWALASAQTPDRSGFASAQERGFFLSGFLGLVLGALLIAGRRRIAARILQINRRMDGQVDGPRPLVGTGAELPALGFALLGLAWAMAQVPQLAVYALAGTLARAFSGPWWSNGATLDLVTRVVYLVAGLALVFASHRAADRWRGGRELPPAADLLAGRGRREGRDESPERRGGS